MSGSTCSQWGEPCQVRASSEVSQHLGAGGAARQGHGKHWPQSPLDTPLSCKTHRWRLRSWAGRAAEGRRHQPHCPGGFHHCRAVPPAVAMAGL